MGGHLHCYVTQGIATNSKSIASYTQTVMQLDPKAKNLHRGLCCDDQY